MDLETVSSVVSRWIHIGTVIVLVGGMVFMRLILLPVVNAALATEQQERFRTACLARWKRVVHIGIALLLISGIYNISLKVPVKPPMPYHMLLGIKLLLAIGVFFIASALVGRGEAFVSFRASASKWLTINVLLAFLIVLLSGVMKHVPDKPSAPSETQVRVPQDAGSTG